jgi:hypothetical protein
MAKSIPFHELHVLVPVPASSVVDPDPHGSTFIWLSRIRGENADPDPGALFTY